LGGNGLTGSTDNTVYVPYLNINNLGTGTSINNLGIDSSGNVVTGNTTVDTNFAITDLTFTGDRVHDLNGYTPTLKDEKDDQTRLIVENLFNGASANSAVSVRSRGPNATTISGTILYGGDSFTGYGSFTDGASGLLTNAFTMTSLGGTPNQRGHINIGSRRATDAEVRIFNGSDDFDFTSLGAKFTTTGFTSYQDVYIDNLPSESVLGTDANGKIIAGTGGETFTGNTSGDCITDLYVTNLYGCSPITVHDTIESVTGIIRTSGGTGAELNLKDSFGPNGTWSITSDNRGYGVNSVWVYAQPSNGLQLGYQLTLSEAIGISILPSSTTPILGNGKEVVITDNTDGSVNSGNIDKRSVFVGTRNSTMLSGVTNSVVLGGVGLSATQDDTVYTSNLNVSGNLDIFGQTTLSGSGQNVLTVIGSGDTNPLFTVQGSSGELFSITDDLTGSLFAVNDISGLPILEVYRY
jgi:hypothetical protein